MGITEIVPTILITIIKVMGISYPQSLGISICGYPPLKSFVEKLSKLFVDNSGFIMPYVHIVEKLSTSDVDNFSTICTYGMMKPELSTKSLDNFSTKLLSSG